MSQTEIALILQQLARLEAVLLDSSEIPSSGREPVQDNEIQNLIGSIRNYIQVSNRKYQDESFMEDASSNGGVNTAQSVDRMGAALHTTSCWIKSRIKGFASKEPLKNPVN